jgi:nitrogen fixation protein FixH
MPLPCQRSPYTLRVLAFLTVALVALAACSSAPTTIRQEQTVDGITIVLETSAAPKLNASEELVVTLTDAQGQPIDGADVYLDLTMTTMPMGTNRPEANALGQGRYTVRTAYTMLGEWDITVVAEVMGVEHQALFKHTVSE